MTIPDPDERQRIINELQPQDNTPVTITHMQAMKCAAIVGALARGHTGYADAGIAVEHFLQASAIDAAYGSGVVQNGSADAAWAIVNAAPWPAPGSPRQQPDVDS